MEDTQPATAAGDRGAPNVARLTSAAVPDGPPMPAHWLLVSRLVGGVLGFLVAAPAVALAVLLGAVAGPVAANTTTFPPDVLEGPAALASVAFVGPAYVFDLHGFAGGNALGLTIAWLVGPIAAAVCGVVVAPSAARAVGSAGLWMGCLTYLAAIAISPLVAVPAAVAESPVQLPAGFEVVPFLWLIAIAALAPIFVVCLIAGPIWAIAVRRTLLILNRAVRPSPVSLPAWPVVLGGILVFLGYAVFTSLAGFMSGPSFD